MSQSKPVRSMTGFARVRRPIGGAEIVITLKSVNHRALDLHFYTGAEFDAFEASMRALLKREIARGHISIRVGLERGGAAGTLRLDAERFAGYLAAFQEAERTFGVAGKPDLNSAFRLPGMLVDSSTVELPPEAEAEVLAALEEAVKTLNEFRSREGCELAGILRQHNARVQAAAVRIEDIRGRALEAFQARLKERLNELLENTAIEPQRLAQEAAILADRSDIHEETARLNIHSRQLDEILNAGGEVGKKLDFLLQEMNRETNTILSKTSGIGEAGLGISDLALGAKSDIEKIREQVLNLE